MRWTAEPDPSEETWADTMFRSDDGLRQLWLRARDGVAGSWRLDRLEPQDAGALVAVEELDVTVSDAVVAAPEHAHDIMRMTRAALERYAAGAAAEGDRLAAELDDAVRELEREDVPGTAEGTHTKRGEDVVPPPDYEVPPS